mgnify:CR=1 FL=1
MSLTAALIGGAAGLGAAKMGSSSAKAINEELMDYSKNRHQYNMQDLEKAGLNPLLSATGAQSPANPPNLQNPSDAGARALSSAASLAGQVAGVNTQIEQANLLKEKARGEAITNDLEEHKKGTFEKAWDIADGITDWLVNAGEDFASSAKSVLKGQGTVDGSVKPTEIRMAPPVPSTQKQIVADQRPHIWDSDYKDKMKTYRYIQSLKN